MMASLKHVSSADNRGGAAGGTTRYRTDLIAEGWGRGGFFLLAEEIADSREPTEAWLTFEHVMASSELHLNWQR